MTKVLEIVGDASRFGVRAVTDAFRRPFEGDQLRIQLAEVGARSLPLVVSSGVALGAVLTLHTRNSLVTFGATAWIPTVQALGFFVEIGPLVTGLLVAGRVGSGIGAVLSNMRATEQIDAIESLSIDSFKFLVVPRILACTLALPIREIRELVAEISTPDSQGVKAGANVRETMTHANAAAANLADATEALKHNFLTRGFFKDRGYYTLADIAPDKYRQDRIFTSRANQRVWLPGADLFQRAANGVEELSAKGKTLLDATFAEYGDAMLERPVVVEGYSSGATSKQLRLSRGRAVVVRQYLATHVQIDLKNLGIIPLKDTPPTGLGRTKWDGICLVVLNGH